MLIVLSVRAQQGVGDYRGLPADLAAAATAYDIAQMKSDRAGLERLLADDYTLANANGRNQTRSESIAESMAPGRTTTDVAITRQVRKTWPDGAVLAGMVDAKGLDHGKPYAMRARFVDVWARRNGRWRVIFTQIHNVIPGK
ncbi:nuclear transport factor 2 family protein [Rhodanobacter sp. Col0626]|uniref:nuclear transport factor 2 family protein n=1 Tax=Rhodanobacter sp. Col0626 TaxID=3415679 RepID=UPI003CE90A92